VTLLQAAISGVLTGGLYALMAVGLSLTWGMLKVINLAHFALILLGGYLSYELATSTDLNPLLTVMVTAPLLALAGAALQWAFDRFRVSEFNSLLVSFGVLIAVVQIVSNVWSADFRRLPRDVNPYATQSVRIGDLAFPTPNLIGCLVAVAIVVAGGAVLQRTFAGRALRAFAQDRPIAAAFGIDSVRLSVGLAAASAASAAVAGMLYALGNALTPSTPFEWFGTVFAVVILGGIGRIGGTLAAGVLIGMVASVVAVIWSPSAAPFVLFSMIVLALLFRPRGLFARHAA
jgi:branched-chain amino acid transport system permease protein